MPPVNVATVVRVGASLAPTTSTNNTAVVGFATTESETLTVKRSLANIPAPSALMATALGV